MELRNLRIILDHNYGFVFNKIIAKLLSPLETRRFRRCGKNFSIVRPFRISGHANIEIGDNFSAGVNLRLEAVARHRDCLFNPRIVIKDNVAMNDFIHIAATNYIEIGNNVLMGSKIFISDHAHGSYRGHAQSNPCIPPNERALTNDLAVVVGDNVWIGESVTILSGVRIGEGSVIGAQSVVTEDVPPFTIAVGCPARIIKRFDEYRKAWMPVKSGD